MADEDITLDGKPLQSLRVADLKAALEQRNLPKSGQKNTLIKRLKGALMLENLQKSSSSHIGLQPNSQIGEEMCQNSFIKQYLAKQQELLRQRLEREAQEEDDADESPAGPEEDEDHSEDNDSSSYVPDKQHRNLMPQPSVAKPDIRGGGDFVMGHGQESPQAPGGRMQRSTFQQGHKEPPAPSPPRAVASLSVRVVGQPDSQGPSPAVPRAQEKEGNAPSEPGSAHPVLHFGRSARGSASNHAPNDSDEDDDDESDDDEDWGPSLGGARKGKRVPPPVVQVAPSVPPANARSKRKLQPPQHIPPPQVHQLRHPTPPPSPPPNLFPLPDTPKQSPPDTDDQEGEAPQAARRSGVVSFPPPTMQRQDSDSSSRSSSPEPPVKRRPGPLSLLVHKMETEEATSAPSMSGETAHSSAGCSSASSLQGSETKRQQESKNMEEEKRLKEEKEEKERQLQQELERERKKTQEQELEKEKREQERKRLEEERKHRQEEEDKEKKRQEVEKSREEKRLKEEQEKKNKRASRDKVVVSKAQDSDSSSDSDSKSDSSSQSSSDSRDKTHPPDQLKRADKGQEAEDEKKNNSSKGLEKRYLSKREVSEPSAAAVTEVEPDSESSMAQQPASGAQPENSESRPEESTTPKAFAARKISLTNNKASAATTDGGAGDPDAGSAAGRKRRWGSSTAVTAKKPSISITTDSLKSLIPDIKVNQEAVVELHPEELQLSGDEENLDTSRPDPDKGLKIRRTVTQIVPSDNQENGQTNEEEEQVEKKTEKEKQRRTSKDKRKNSLSEEASEMQVSVNLDGDTTKVTPSDSLVRRSISQQKSGVSVTIDDPVRTTSQPSPPRGKVSNIIHVTNLVRPFTLLQLKELLNRTGSVLEEGFWIDKIKSHCFVTYATAEEAVATRTALHGVKWPTSNPKVLNVDFCEQDELDFHKGVLKPDREEDQAAPSSVPQNRLPPLMPERDKDRERDRERDRGVRDLWAERQREMERRERARGEREWDRDKIREFARPGEDGRRSRSRERDRKRRDRAKSKEKKTDKKAEKGDEPPAKLLDDLFLKTKAAPCIYWLPLTEEQAAQRILDRTERQKERERRRKEQEEEEEKKREEEKKERLKGREKDGNVAASGGAAGRGADADRERDRGRDREGDKRRDSSHRSRRPSQGAGSGRRSRSRSNPRDRRR